MEKTASANLCANTLDPVTDYTMYNKFSGYHGNRNQNPLSTEQLKDIESVLPCPHNPSSQSFLYLKGESKLKLEAESAKRNMKLYMLNKNNIVPNKWEKILPDTCLIEQDGVRNKLGQIFLKKVIITEHKMELDRKLTLLRGSDPSGHTSVADRKE